MLGADRVVRGGAAVRALLARRGTTRWRPGLDRRVGFEGDEPASVEFDASLVRAWTAPDAATTRKRRERPASARHCTRGARPAEPPPGAAARRPARRRWKEAAGYVTRCSTTSRSGRRLPATSPFDLRGGPQRLDAARSPSRSAWPRRLPVGSRPRTRSPCWTSGAAKLLQGDRRAARGGVPACRRDGCRLGWGVGSTRLHRRAGASSYADEAGGASWRMAACVACRATTFAPFYDVSRATAPPSGGTSGS